MQHRYGIAVALALCTLGLAACGVFDGSIVGRTLDIRSTHDGTVRVHGIARIYVDRVLFECAESRSGLCHADVHAPRAAGDDATPSPARALARFVVPAGEAHVLAGVPVAFRLCIGIDGRQALGCAEVTP